MSEVKVDTISERTPATGSEIIIDGFESGGGGKVLQVNLGTLSIAEADNGE